MFTQIRAALIAFSFLTLLTGVVYPLAVTGVSKALFSRNAEGNTSLLLGQSFDEDPKYFWGRLSATTPTPYNAGASTGSNLGPTNPALADAAKARAEALRKANPPGDSALESSASSTPIPIDLVTASASGLDPDITPAGALYQARRVAHVRGLPEERVRSLVERHIEGPDFGVFGEPHVNVAALNRALDHESTP